MEDHGLGNIRWPALSFGAPNCSMMMYDSPEILTFLSPSSLRSIAALTEHFLIDSTGRRFDLAQPEFAEPLSGFQCLVASLFHSKHRVRWQCSPGGVAAVAEDKRLVEEDWRTCETM